MHSSNQTETHAKAQSRKRNFVAILFVVLLAVPMASAQEVADTIRIRTRVVFMDALVKDKKTGTPISDLTPENFELFDDGKPRAISYFTRDGHARKPLAMVIILDCREDGAGRFLKRPEILKAMADELAGRKDRLAPCELVLNEIWVFGQLGFENGAEVACAARVPHDHDVVLRVVNHRCAVAAARA